MTHIIHATGYLWDAANALLGEGAAERKGRVRTRLAQVGGRGEHEGRCGVGTDGQRTRS